MKNNKKNIDNYNKVFRSKLSEDVFMFFAYVKSRRGYLAAVAFICIVIIGFIAFFSVKDGQNKTIYNTEMSTYLEVKAEYDKITKKYLKEVLTEEFTQEQLATLSQKYYSYSLYINNKAVKPDDFVLNSEGNRIVLHILEKLEKNPLPDEIAALAHSTELAAKIKAVSKHTPTINQRIEGNIYKTEMIFDDIKVGEIVTLEIDSEFAKKLGLNNTSIEITTNKK